MGNKDRDGDMQSHNCPSRTFIHCSGVAICLYHPHHQLLCGLFTQEIEVDPGILAILTDEATLARVVRSPHSVIPLPAPGQPGQNPYTRAVRQWFFGLVGTHSRATGQQLTPALKTGNPQIVSVINMACIRV